MDLRAATAVILPVTLTLGVAGVALWSIERLRSGAADLDAARARERELQRLADEASEALGAAISEVREALGKV